MGRAVLVDVARWRGVEWMDGGDRIDPDELDAVLAAQEVTVHPGDEVHGSGGLSYRSRGFEMKCDQ